MDLPETVTIFMKSRELLQMEKNRNGAPIMEYFLRQFAKNGEFEKSVLEEFKILLLLDEVEEVSQIKLLI